MDDVKQSGVVLGKQHRLLLAALAEGQSAAAAAEGLGISRRTAERRLSEARDILGVRTTAEAVALVAPACGAKLALTANERQILELVAIGLTSREISLRLCIAPSTVDTYTRTAMAKTASRTRVQAAAQIAASTKLAQIREANRDALS